MVRLAPARTEDVPAILALIRALAAFEQLSDQVVATEDALRHWLFGPRPAAEVILAWADAEAVGFALFFQNFSTFLARPGLYLEDLFVVEAWRGRGVGRQLLTRLAQIAQERGCGRFEWAVLEWNAPAVAFYERMGAEVSQDWRVCRLTGDALVRAAAGR
jgi:GNAT superfamily N-acetyltransferase